MALLLWLFLGVMVVAAVTTVVAVRRAKEGYEDEAGFHLVAAGAPPAAGRSARVIGRAPEATADSRREDVATVRSEAALPSGLMGAG